MSCPADPNGITSHQWVCYDETATGRWFVCRNCGAEELEPAANTPYPSARVREALAEAYDRSAPPMGWPGPNA